MGRSVSSPECPDTVGQVIAGEVRGLAQAAELARGLRDGLRICVQLARLVLQGCNLLLLDEPLNHLDVESREHFEAALKVHAGTVMVVAHDRVFLSKLLSGPARHVLAVRDGQVRRSGW